MSDEKKSYWPSLRSTIEAIQFACKSVNCAYADGGCKIIGCKFGKWRDALAKAGGEEAKE